MKKSKILLEKNGVVLHKLRCNAFEISNNGENVKTPEGKTRFTKADIFPNGIRVKEKDGKYLAFLFKKNSWFKTPSGIMKFKKVFILGDVEASVSGEGIQNYPYQ